MYEDTDKLGEKARHEAAILWLAMNFVIGDEVDLDYAVEHQKQYIFYMEHGTTSPWRDGKHDGDCTKQPMTCQRCLYENALAWVDMMFEQSDHAGDYRLKNENP